MTTTTTPRGLTLQQLNTLADAVIAAARHVDRETQGSRISLEAQADSIAVTADAVRVKYGGTHGETYIILRTAQHRHAAARYAARYITAAPGPDEEETGGQG